MRIAVLGAGVIGVTTAHELMRDGHEVVVIDRAGEPASFSSFANAGCLGAGYALAWGSPRATGVMLRSLLRRDQMVRFRLSRLVPGIDPDLWRYIFAFRRECSAEAARRNSLRMARLSVYSQAMLRRVAEETGLSYDRRTGGLLYYFRSGESLARAVAGAEILRSGGVRIEVLDAAGLARVNPALAQVADDLAGGLHALDDESGDARVFTIALAGFCRDAGAELMLETEISGFELANGRIRAVKTSRGPVEADAFVLAAGALSPKLAHMLGLRLIMAPVKGYAMTFPMARGKAAPTVGGVDVDLGIAYAPMGKRLRMTRGLHFAGFDTSHRPSDFRAMDAAARAALPGAADFSQPAYWAGLRPMTPTGVPIITRAGPDNMVINTGQGNFGWTMACGSARIAADLVAGREPAIDCAA